jgi:hypothetical protein
MSQITGRVFITVSGQRLASKPGAKLQFGGIKREAVIGDGGVLGYTESIEAPGIQCTIAHNSNTSLTQLNSIVGGTGSFDTDSGKSFVLQGLFCLGALELTTGEIALNFSAMSCKEV